MREAVYPRLSAILIRILKWALLSPSGNLQTPGQAFPVTCGGGLRRGGPDKKMAGEDLRRPVRASLAVSGSRGAIGGREPCGTGGRIGGRRPRRWPAGGGRDGTGKRTVYVERRPGRLRETIAGGRAVVGSSFGRRTAEWSGAHLVERVGGWTLRGLGMVGAGGVG